MKMFLQYKRNKFVNNSHYALLTKNKKYHTHDMTMNYGSFGIIDIGNNMMGNYLLYILHLLLFLVFIVLRITKGSKNKITIKEKKIEVIFVVR